ncbi:MAG: hypothetical protein ACO1PN_16405 [Betaproteobacteria bacterium]
MRRSDFDITDRIRTTDPIEVSDHVFSLFKGLYPGGNSRPMQRAFEDLSRMYHGKHPDYHPCDTEYHDIQHVLDVTLAMARLLDGYQRDRKDHAPLSPELFNVGIVTALFHDVGYLRRRNDHKHRFGAEYTLTHVSRGSKFLRTYLPKIGLKRHAADASVLVHFTGYERDADTIRVDDPLLRRVGEILGTADIIAQMSDRCYLEKCHDRLYPEFVLGGIARRRMPDGTIKVVYKSGKDLLSKTPAFYQNAMKRLDEKLHRAYRYAETHFGGSNLYIREMDKNAAHAVAATSADGRSKLRRTTPSTLIIP